MAKRALSGPPLATTFSKGGKSFGHHVQETTDGETVCIEDTLTDCARCGRTPAEHEELAERVAREAHPDPNDYGDCSEYVAPKPCRCSLEKWKP